MNLVFNARMSDYELEDSGSIITTKDGDIHFFVQDLEYVLSFVNEDKSPAQLRVKSNSGKKLELELVNFNTSLGIGNINPFPMGRIGDKQLFIMIRVNSSEEGGKTLYYSWYSKRIINDGNKE